MTNGFGSGLAALAVTVMLVSVPAGPARPQAADDPAIADSLAAMLRAGRNVVSADQVLINDPALGDKGLDGKTVLAATVALYRQATGTDPMAVDPASRHGRLLRAQMDAIAAVVDANKPSIDAKGTGFKGFIPAIFARLVNEEFARRAGGEAQVKATAPPELVRNRKARPDAWEAEIIQDKFLAPGWPRGQAYAAEVQQQGKPVFRVMVPEYYAASCLSCHGGPKGSTDITGYPREGGKEGDLGGAISITLMH